MKQFSIVIPVYNEDQFIDELLVSIENASYPKDQYEIIVVSDASTDRTAEVVRNHPQVRLIELPKNVGRYQARKTGAEAARYPYILFVDARVMVDPNIFAALDQIEARAVNAYSLGRKKINHFETFYHAIRRLAFWKFYRTYGKPVFITEENFDSMPKGTTAFFVEKAILFQAYGDLSGDDMGRNSSDDTKLIRAIVNHTPVLLHPDVKITSIARTSFVKSIHHLYVRGTLFVDYYFNPDLGKFWLVIVLPLLASFFVLAGLFFVPIPGLWKLAMLVSLDVLFAILLARSFRELWIIAYMLPLCALVFYLGVIRGIFIKGYKVIRGK